MLQQFFVAAFPEPMREAMWLFLKFAPIWLPIFLLYAFFSLWIRWIRAEFINNQETCLLEINLPSVVDKSPLAMEAVLGGLHNRAGEATYYKKFWIGSTRPWFSLEIVSTEGQVHMYVWTRRAWKRQVEFHFYAQYPDIEIVEVPDYTRQIRFDLDEIDLWGIDMKKTLTDLQPIKSYVDYGMDKNPKEEERIDPIAHVLEFMASMGPGEHLWLQILIRVNKAERFKPGTFIQQTFQKRISDRVAEIYANPEKVNVSMDDGGGRQIKTLSADQEFEIDLLWRTGGKQAFDTGIRMIYLARRENFDGTNIPGIIGAFRSFNSESGTFNAIGPDPARYLIKFDYPWQDYRDIRQNRERYKVFDAYRRRSWFYAPYRTPYFNMNVEELATIFHLPGGDVKTPTLQRIPSTRETAPSNLPV